MKYIAYVRKSTDEKDKQVLSIDAQVAELKEFAKKQNLEILDQLASQYQVSKLFFHHQHCFWLSGLGAMILFLELLLFQFALVHR